MDDDDEQRLRNHYKELQKRLIVKDVMGHLIQKGIINVDDKEKINAGETRGEKAERLLDMLPFKGRDAYREFVAALQEHRCYDHLVEHLLTGMQDYRYDAGFHHPVQESQGNQMDSLVRDTQRMRLQESTKPTVKTPKPVTKDIELTPQVFFKISRHVKIMNNPRAFGGALGLTPGDVENIFFRNRDNLTEILYELLSMWEQQQGSAATGTKLLKILCKFECADLAAQLQQEDSDSD